VIVIGVRRASSRRPALRTTRWRRSPRDELRVGRVGGIGFVDWASHVLRILHGRNRRRRWGAGLEWEVALDAAAAVETLIADFAKLGQPESGRIVEFGLRAELEALPRHGRRPRPSLEGC
jgi:hypothetical protein